ncbi:hypothetical protein BH10ACI2_BH10ACI2_11470 [soil metagenome]
MKWIVEQIPELTGYTVEWAEPGRFYLSRRNDIYRSTDLKPPFEHIAAIDAPLWKRLASNFRLAQRLMRFMVYNVVPMPNGEIFVTFDKTVGVIKEGKYTDLPGLERPCRVLRFGCALDTYGNVYFGEYLANTERGEMRIYRYTAGGTSVETVHTFQPGSIKHIHGLYYDKYTGAIYCLTGDDDPECQILRSYDGCKTFETVGSGDETWRTVSLLFDEIHFTYGSDAEFRSNQIFRVDRLTLRRETLGEVNGTVFYSKNIGSDLFFTTTAENAPSQKENVAALWLLDAEGVCKSLIAFEKDRWPGGLFMFGTIHFPYVNSFDDRLYYSLVGVKGDNKTYCISRK